MSVGERLPHLGGDTQQEGMGQPLAGCHQATTGTGASGTHGDLRDRVSVGHVVISGVRFGTTGMGLGTWGP